MELFETPTFFIIKNGENSLWCSREDGKISAHQGKKLEDRLKPTCLGTIFGVIGKFKITQESVWRLLLIRQQRKIGQLPGSGKSVYVITRVTIVTLDQSSTKDLDMEPCILHNTGNVKSSHFSSNNQSSASQKPLQKTWNQFKMAAESMRPTKLPFRLPLDLVSPSASSQTSQAKWRTGNQEKDLKDKEKFERRILEEILKMFNDSESFYYCPAGDLTNSLQRQHQLKNTNQNNIVSSQPDDRFFWNKYMLTDLVEADPALARPWLVPVIQGYVQIEDCPVTFDDDGLDPVATSDQETHMMSDIYKLTFKLCLISRRSRHRAGTRYKRRGVDEDGNTANYVETEQILEFANHVVSFVQVRGSVPLFWSQTGMKYKPPPKIERDDESNRAAFQRHFDSQLSQYASVTVVSLVDQAGKEKVIADAFLSHILTYNHADMTYIAFDFHEYCRGMRFENVNILTESIIDTIRDMRYCWVDDNGVICEQRGVYRVNCIDCLDRTNVVQSAIARIVLEIQCRKLGLLSPERSLASKCRSVYQQMWANNGDALSRQYAGTAALKGDYTRTGERRFAGMMKDGVNSANRYYINRVKDIYRQATIDLLLGNLVTDELNFLYRSGSEKLDGALPENGRQGLDEEDGQLLVEKEENLKTLIDECKKMLITEPDECLGGWGLIDCDPETGDPAQQDMDIILLLSQKAFYVARYDDETDTVMNYQRIPLEDVDNIDIGILAGKTRKMCIRIHYHRKDNSGSSPKTESGYFHTFCSTGTRLFNNIVITIRNEDEARESLRAIAETFHAAKKLLDQTMTITDIKLDKRSSRCPPARDIVDIACEAQERVESTVPRPPAVSRDPSFSNLLQQVLPEPSAGGQSKIELISGSGASQSQKLLDLGRAVVRKTSHGGAEQQQSKLVAVHYRNVDSADESDDGSNVTHHRQTRERSPTTSILVNDDKKAEQQVDVQASDIAEVAATGSDADQIVFECSGEDKIDDTLAHKSIGEPGVAENTVADDCSGAPVMLDEKSASAAAHNPAIVLEEVEAHSHPSLVRRHSLLKMSHSESSLATSATSLSVAPTATLATSSAEDLTYNADDDFDGIDIGSGSEYGGHVGTGLARLLRGKMAAALAAPRAATAGPAAAAARRRQLEELAKNRLAKSKLQFKGWRTRVMLL